MKDKKLFLLGTLAVFLLGSGFHFLYDLLGKALLAAPFFAVNESVWEHLKLLSTSALVWLGADYFLTGKLLRPSFFASRAAALPIALLLIPVVFYFMKGAFRFESTVFDIALFLAASALYQWLAMRFEKSGAAFMRRGPAGITILVLIFILFAVFTFAPPHAPLFMDPPTGSYGVSG